MTKRHLVAGLAAATATLITLSACGSSATHHGPTSSAKASAAAGPHNAADVAFATDMVPHHAQAVQMADDALSRAHDSHVIALARIIKTEQAPEITAMSGWLTGWHEPVPDSSAGHSMHMDHGSSGPDMPGMMSESDMAALQAATGVAFDKLFLTQMITHHTGALTMARTELSQGRNDDAQALARSIIAGQSKEISEMKTLLVSVR